MGFGSGKDAVNRWRIREREVLENICRQRGIEISEPTKSRGSYSVDEYKELQKRLESLNQDVDRLNIMFQIMTNGIKRSMNFSVSVRNLMNS